MNLLGLFITALIVSMAVSVVTAWAMYKVIDIVTTRKRKEKNNGERKIVFNYICE